jgi:hypothetical protein
MPCLLGLEPFPQMIGGLPIRLRRHRQPPKRGQGRANEVSSRSVAVRAVVGGGTVLGADSEHARVDRIEHGKLVDVVGAKAQNLCHQGTVALPTAVAAPWDMLEWRAACRQEQEQRS